MTHEDAGHYAAKHPGGEIDSAIQEAIEAKEKNGRVTCASAHSIATRLGCAPSKVGMTIDLLEKRIIRCQMGLFGYGVEKKKAVEPAQTVPEPLAKAIKAAVADDRLTCLAAWKIADAHGIAKMDVAAACDALEIKIKPCQLGAF